MREMKTEVALAATPRLSQPDADPAELRASALREQLRIPRSCERRHCASSSKKMGVDGKLGRERFLRASVDACR